MWITIHNRQPVWTIVSTTIFFCRGEPSTAIRWTSSLGYTGTGVRPCREVFFGGGHKLNSLGQQCWGCQPLVSMCAWPYVKSTSFGWNKMVPWLAPEQALLAAHGRMPVAASGIGTYRSSARHLLPPWYPTESPLSPPWGSTDPKETHMTHQMLPLYGGSSLVMMILTDSWWPMVDIQ